LIRAFSAYYDFYLSLRRCLSLENDIAPLALNQFCVDEAPQRGVPA
jgi:hypothetical protein